MTLLFLTEAIAADATTRAFSNRELRLGNTASAPATQPDPNPPADGFNLEESDPRAIEIADSVMEKLGGRAAWDRTRFLTWNFFGLRSHIWNKHTGDIRIEYDDRDSGEPVTITMNIHSREGRAWSAGMELKDESELITMLQDGYYLWVNDCFWFIMPYKLKDSGVTLKYLGERAMEDGREADVLELTFHGVGVTPQNKYEVFVAQESGLVEQWAFYENASDAEPRFITPWRNWRQYGEIMHSDDRGELRGREAKILDIAVFDQLPRSIFESPRAAEARPAATAPSNR